MKIDYRPEIDGLRALAVISVLIYHAKIKIDGYYILSGGFIGVDIFFVISGYLITSIIYKEISANNSFSFKNFYQRRIRRIIPPLFFVMLASFPFAYFFLLPSDFIDFSKSILFSIGFVSNYFFYLSEMEYGANSSLLLPFLHTWSLSIEEQFYIFFPLVFFLIYKFLKKYHFIFFCLLLLSSLFLTIIFSYENSLKNFYLIQTRAWEILFGSLLALMSFKYQNKISPIKSDIFCISGLLLIFYSLFFFNESTSHPSYISLIPVIGVCLIIWFTRSDNFFKKFLSNKIFVFIGLISYSLYLWHFPVFSFVRIIEFTQSSILKKIFVVILVFLLSILSYYLIEQPSRNRKNSFKKILYLILICFALNIGLNSITIHNKGFANRIPDFLVNMINQTNTPWNKLINEQSGKTCYGALEPCIFNSQGENKIFLIGDSHATTIAYDLKKKIVKRNDQFAYIHTIFFPGFNLKDKKTGNINSDFYEYNNRVRSLLSKEKNATIIFLMRYPLYLSERFFDNQEGGKEPKIEYDSKFVSDGEFKSIEESFIKIVKNFTKQNRVILVYPVPEVGWWVPNKLKNKFFIQGEEIKKENYLTTSFDLYKERSNQSFQMLNKILKDKNVDEIYPHKFFCNNEIPERCLTHDDKNIFYFDDDHLSEYSSQILAREILKKIYN